MTDEEKAEEYAKNYPKSNIGYSDNDVIAISKNSFLEGLAEGRKDFWRAVKNYGELEKENARLSKMLDEAIDFIEQEDMQCKMCSYYLSCQNGDCAYKDEIPTSDVIRAELEKRVENEK